MVFRFTINARRDNLNFSRLGDRTLTLFLNQAGFYHGTTYTYTNMNGAGISNIIRNVQH